MLEVYAPLFHYDAWANARVLDALECQGVGAGRPLELLAHILIAKQLWLARIRGDDTSRIPIWPAWSLADCRRLGAAGEDELQRFLAGLQPADVMRRVVYRASSGQEYRTAIGDILLHMTHHAAYHRGQIATCLRSMSREPANTDYITYARCRAAQEEADAQPGLRS